MSDTRTPGVERMASTSSKKGAPALLTGILAIACVALIIACYTVYSNAQGRIQDVRTKAEQDVKAAQDKAAADVTSARNDFARVTSELQAARRLAMGLPPALRGTSDQDTAARIQKMFDEYSAMTAAAAQTPKPTPGGGQAGAGGNSPAGGGAAAALPGQDTPAAWLENISRQVAKGSINTKLPTGNDPAKVATHRGIQMVLARVGAFGKPPTGNPDDTYTAVVAFQKANGLTADGIIGKGTWGKVREKYESMPRALGQ